MSFFTHDGSQCKGVATGDSVGLNSEWTTHHLHSFILSLGNGASMKNYNIFHAERALLERLIRACS